MSTQTDQAAPSTHSYLPPAFEADAGRTGRSAYDGYNAWKNWSEDRFLKTSPFEADYLTADFAGVDLDGRTLLEIGFGNGALLAWARNRGAAVYGIEILDTSVSRAAAFGIPLLSSNISDNIPEYAGFFDVIVAYDVLEHLTIDEVAETLAAAATLLKPGGKLMLRFPNGQSPFGRSLQHADHTHRSILSAAIIGQLTVGTPLRITRSGGGASHPRGGGVRGLAMRAKRGVRSATEWFIRRVFDLDCELGNNVVLLLTKHP